MKVASQRLLDATSYCYIRSTLLHSLSVGLSVTTVNPA